MMKKLRVKVYIDGANMFYTQKKLGWLVDWRKIKNYLKKNYQISEIRFYHSRKDKKKEEEDFFDFLKSINFKLITKPLKKIKDEITGKLVFKANFDVEITRDILLDLLFFKKLDEGIVFFSGDSDFAPLFWDLKKRFKKKVFIYSSRVILSWELRLASTECFYLEDIKKDIFLKRWNLTKGKKFAISKLLSRRSR